MKKQILSVLLATIMVVGLLTGFALTASAADTGTTVLPVENGTVEFDATDANPGDIITVTVTPDDGCVVNTWNLGGEYAAVYVGENTFQYCWNSNEKLVEDFALIPGCAIYFDCTGAPAQWDIGYSRLICIQEDLTYHPFYILETEEDLWYATVPDGAIAIYFQNYLPGQPEELVPGGYQWTHTYEVEAGKTYTYGKCEDTDNDHWCDVCYMPLSDLCSDEDNDHLCDVCYMPMSGLCSDEDNDHWCDVCDMHMSALCSDDNNDHECDICEVWISFCIDEEGNDFQCDICGEWMIPYLDMDAVAGDQQITVTWTALSDVEAVFDGVTYSVLVTDEDGNEDTYTDYSRDGDACTAVITGLTNDVTYSVYVEVTCEDWDGYSTCSGDDATPYSASATVPGVPADVQAVAGPKQITVTWTAPENGGAKILGYEIEYAPKGAEAGNYGGTYGVDADTTSATIADLEASTEYEIKVRAINAVGSGAYSDAVYATPEELTLYDLWIFGWQVTSADASDIFGVGQISYDAATSTLTLTDAVLEWGYTTAALIHCGEGLPSLTIKGVDTEAEGDNSIIGMGSAISAGDTDLIFEGSFGEISSADMYAVFAKSVTVAEGCTIGDIGGTAGTAVYGSDFVTIAGTVGDIQGTSCGISSDGDISVSGKAGNITGKTYGIYTNGMLIISAPIEISGDVAIAAGNGIGTSNVAVSVPADYVFGAVEVRENEYYTTVGTEDDEANFTPATTVKYVIGHSVIVDDTVSGGVVWVDKDCVAAGTHVNVYVSPDEGMYVDGITVKDESGKEIPVTANGDDTYTYEQPDGNVTVTAAFTAVYYTVTVPAEQIGYKLETDVTKVKHGGDVYISVVLKEGYEKTDAFAVKVNGKKVELTEYDNVVVQAAEDLVITVEGVALKTYVITFTDENGVYKTLNVKHGDKIEMPEPPAKEGYTVEWDTVIDTATGDATVKAVYTKNSAPVSSGSQSPNTGDNSDLWLWVTLLFVSGAAVLAITVCDRKEKAAINR